MALTEIEYGSLASSETMNNNFEYLDNKITSVSEDIVSATASINSNIASINTTLTNFSEGTNKNIEDINSSLSVLKENTLYVNSYVNGSSWYKEYFSDKEKTTRVWLEQGGFSNFGNAQFQTRTITFAKPFSSICNVIGILFAPGAADDSNQGISSWSNESFTYVHRGWGSGVVWRACGV